MISSAVSTEYSIGTNNNILHRYVVATPQYKITVIDTEIHNHYNCCAMRQKDNISKLEWVAFGAV
jgi:hypothetical protein